MSPCTQFAARSSQLPEGARPGPPLSHPSHSSHSSHAPGPPPAPRVPRSSEPWACPASTPEPSLRATPGPSTPQSARPPSCTSSLLESFEPRAASFEPREEEAGSGTPPTPSRHPRPALFLRNTHHASRSAPLLSRVTHHASRPAHRAPPLAREHGTHGTDGTYGTDGEDVRAAPIDLAPVLDLDLLFPSVQAARLRPPPFPSAHPPRPPPITRHVRAPLHDA